MMAVTLPKTNACISAVGIKKESRRRDKEELERKRKWSKSINEMERKLSSREGTTIEKPFGCYYNGRSLAEKYFCKL